MQRMICPLPSHLLERNQFQGSFSVGIAANEIDVQPA